MFADRARIIIKSGKGGDGHVSFRREKYVPDGGPDGGDGGHGGAVIFTIDEGINTLTDYRHRRKFAAEPGEEGGKKNCHGKNGQDLCLKVPEGTIIKEAATGRIIADMSGKNRSVTVLKGGRGGMGNQHYATATMQAPKYAQPGQDAVEIEVTLELKLIADVGLIGFPNVGKSTFLSVVTNAHPKIANYPFTTLQPNLGVVDMEDGFGFVIADIPGLMEGASQGVGLGHEFLRHVERTKVMIHIVDAAGTEGRDPVADIHAINEELRKYDPKLLDKPQVIAANKMDLLYEDGEDNEDNDNNEDGEDILGRLRREFEDKEGIRVFPISAVSKKGLKELLYQVKKLLEDCPREPVVYEPEFDPSKPALRPEEYTVKLAEDGVYTVEGPKIEKMLGYTNLESEKGFLFFQKFIKEQGILEELEKLGIEDGDTVRLYGNEFDYYK